MSLVCRLRWRCCGGGRWRCLGSRTAIPSKGAAVSSGGERDSSSFLLLRFLSSSSATVFPLPFIMFFSYFIPCFKLFFPLLLGFLMVFFVSVHSLSTRFPFFSFLPPLFLCFFVFFSLPFLLLSSPFLGSIYRAKGVAFYCSHGEQPAGRPLGATAKVRPPSPVSGRCAVGGRPLCSVGGLQAREGPTKIQKKKKLLFLLPRCMFGGEEERGTVSFKTTPFCSFPFFFFFFF